MRPPRRAEQVRLEGAHALLGGPARSSRDDAASPRSSDGKVKSPARSSRSPDSEPGRPARSSELAYSTTRSAKGTSPSAKGTTRRDMAWSRRAKGAGGSRQRGPARTQAGSPSPTSTPPRRLPLPHRARPPSVLASAPPAPRTGQGGGASRDWDYWIHVPRRRHRIAVTARK